jgi:hypothetical protein
MSFFRAIRWALVAEIVITQLAIIVILEMFRRDKPVTNNFTNHAKRRLMNAKPHNQLPRNHAQRPEAG